MVVKQGWWGTGWWDQGDGEGLGVVGSRGGGGLGVLLVKGMLVVQG